MEPTPFLTTGDLIFRNYAMLDFGNIDVKGMGGSGWPTGGSGGFPIVNGNYFADESLDVSGTVHASGSVVSMFSEALVFMVKVGDVYDTAMDFNSAFPDCIRMGNSN